MVLQRAPVGAAVWGYAFAVGDKVTVDVDQGGSYTATAEQGTVLKVSHQTNCVALFMGISNIIISTDSCKFSCKLKLKSLNICSCSNCLGLWQSQ